MASLALQPTSCSDQNEASTGTGEVREGVGTGPALCVRQHGQVKQDLCLQDVRQSDQHGALEGGKEVGALFGVLLIGLDFQFSLLPV